MDVIGQTLLRFDGKKRLTFTVRAKGPRQARLAAALLVRSRLRAHDPRVLDTSLRPHEISRHLATADLVVASSFCVIVSVCVGRNV